MRKGAITMYAEIQTVLTELSNLVKIAERNQLLGNRRYLLHDLQEIRKQMTEIMGANS
jgi:hypothetical protein